ncbi:AGE family epimerase/isomerase [Marinibactrum halimedae]|uniref:N-acylglucosamine 2-epimerase n=1 Tax=Marinibactrum halimedae TaxID=1444977 RepID=A0AA37WKX4_9GAMM|nr:AGE family epimerase/isomerase [Marinibactrum halimedae]MCD9460703.1 AGE family epimerase/isomerase [Marinibactrum halimedae]GLS25174.1 N-acylglucosamine 2-epimerase [Marinibactrum halimedae]
MNSSINSSGNAFFSDAFLVEHCDSILDFYTSRVVDNSGGYHQNYYDDGTVFDSDFKQLVSSTRIVVNYATAAMIYDNANYLEIARHGLAFIEQTHWQPETSTYAWTLRNNQPEDMTQQAYGYAFVLLAYAAARKAGIVTTNEPLLKVYELLEARFWQNDFGLYADEISPEGKLSDYRGQNSNMHLCEAMLAAYEASSEPLFLQRAEQLAENIAFRQAKLTDNLIWEHYQSDFQPDWDYNRDDPKNLYRPWGFQPGHQTEWTKLLLILHRHSPNQKWVDQAKHLFDAAYKTAWDEECGGLIYGFDPEGKWCDDDKYFWVQAESFAAAAMLYDVTGDEIYREYYNALWQYSWDHFVDHDHGAWYRVLRRNNEKMSNEKSAAGAKCDYHTLGACYEVLRVLKHPKLV